MYAYGWDGGVFTMSPQQSELSSRSVFALMRRILRETEERPGGSRLDLYSQGYTQAKQDIRKLIRDDLKKLKAKS